MNFKLEQLRQIIRQWAPVLIGIPAMLLLSALWDVARFFLFGHHLFWMIGSILAIISLGRDTASMTRKRKAAQSSIKARQPVKAPKRPAKSKPALPIETPSDRLARLQKDKEVVDRKIEQLSANDPKYVK